MIASPAPGPPIRGTVAPRNAASFPPLAPAAVLPLVLAAFLLAAFRAEAEPKSGATVTVGLRYDDCTALSREDLERRILAACARDRIPITFGVVPEIGKGDGHDPAPAGNAPLPQSRKDMLAAAKAGGFLEIALHGYAHKTAKRGTRSEFAGVPEARQREILAQGKAELEAFAGPVATFIPPWNAYDAHTLTALSAAGFTALSADAAGPSLPSSGLRHVHATCLIPDLRRAVAAARAAGGGIVIPYFHPYEFTEVDSLRGFFSMAGFEADMAWLAAQPDVQTLTLGEIARMPAAAPEVYGRYSRWARLTPPFLERRFRPAFWVYPDPGFPGRWGRVRLRLCVAIWYLLLAAAGAIPAFAFGKPLFRATSARARVHIGRGAAVSGLLLLAAGTVFAAFPAAVAGAVLAGLGLGIWRRDQGRKYLL